MTEFDGYFGEDTKLENWQRLCRDVGIDDDLPSINKCKQVCPRFWIDEITADNCAVKALKGVWVNIYDLVHAVRTNTTPPRRFQSQGKLAAYTLKNRKVYPKEKAKKGGPVRALLAHIF